MAFGASPLRRSEGQCRPSQSKPLNQPSDLSDKEADMLCRSMHLVRALSGLLLLSTAQADSSRITVERSGGALWISATNGGVLESSDSLSGTWQTVMGITPEVANGIARYPVPATTGSRFFRVRWAATRGYDLGNPTLLDLFLAPNGNDENPGTRELPLQHLSAAWNRIPERTPLTGTGFRINFLPGSYPCEGDCINYFAGRWGTFEHPILLRAADGPGTVTLLGGLNLEDVRYLYLLDLTLRGGPEAAFGNNVLHLAQADHLLVRQCRIEGPQAIADTANPFQEVFKANQCEHVYVEDSDLSGTYQTVLDYVAVRHGHVLRSKIHRSGGRAAYCKGGSAYLVFEGNEVYDCREAGIQVGEGSNFTFLQPPWVHYEAYDVKVVNNILHHVYGAGLSVAGGYNVLLAHNTLYRVGLEDEGGRSWTLAQFIRGGRVNMIVDEYPTEAAARAKAQELIDLGGWGTSSVTEMGTEQTWIPNRNVLVFNNLFYNPAGTRTAFSHFLVLGPLALPPQAVNLPNPSRTDDNLRLAGNVVWNGPGTELELVGSYTGETGCAGDNLTCNPERLLQENWINIVEPDLVGPEQGDFRPRANGRLKATPTPAIPDFAWNDAPTRPVVPAGNLSNAVTQDAAGNQRSGNATVGAWQ
jgi:hypothetical protein